MAFGRGDLERIHEKIEERMKKIGLLPHYRPQNLLSLPQNSYGCDFCALRYWRKKDRERIEELRTPAYEESCLELRVADGKLYVGLWFAKNQKSPNRYYQPEDQQAIWNLRGEYPGYSWTVDHEKKNPAPTDTKEAMVKWLRETNHETVFLKALDRVDIEMICTELEHLKVYLDLLLDSEKQWKA